MKIHYGILIVFFSLISIAYPLCFASDTKEATSPIIVKFIISSTATEARQNYELALIKSALAKSLHKRGDYIVKTLMRDISTQRLIRELEIGKLINITASNYGNQKFKEITKIDVPIMRGILGYRRVIIRREDASSFYSIHNLQGLLTKRVGQVKDWSDIEVYRKVGFKIVEGENIDNTLDMLVGDRFDFFPLGINEYAREYDKRSHLHDKLYVDKSLLVHYPWPFYFYISNREPELISSIRKGLEAMLMDGSLERLHYLHFKHSMDELKAHSGPVIKLKNPYL